MLVRVSPAFDCNARFDKLLVVFGQELGPRWVVREEEERQEGAEDGDEAFDDELDERVSSGNEQRG